MEKPREIIVHQSCNRPNLLLGCDRELLLLCGMLAAMLIFALVTWWGVAFGITLWAMSLAALSRMGKADPLMRLIYIRHVRYRPFYPAKAGIEAESVGTPRKWR